MEMKDVEVEAGNLDSAGHAMLETKTEEKEEPKTYCKLQKPSEDIYAEAVFDIQEKPVRPTKPTKSRKNVLLAVCIVLSVISLCQLIIIFIILNGKTAAAAAQAAVHPVQQLSVEPKPRRNPFMCFSIPLKPTPTKSPNSHLCPDDWTFFDNDCFYLSKDRRNWQSSREFCKGVNGDLAVISNQGLWEFLSKKAIIVYWVGLEFRNKWVWVNDVELAKSQQLTGDPDDGTCGILDSETLSLGRSNCIYQTHFICQRRGGA